MLRSNSGNTYAHGRRRRKSPRLEPTLTYCVLALISACLRRPSAAYASRSSLRICCSSADRFASISFCAVQTVILGQYFVPLQWGQDCLCQVTTYWVCPILKPPSTDQRRRQSPFAFALSRQEPSFAVLGCNAAIGESTALLRSCTWQWIGTLKISSSVGVTHMTNAGPPMQRIAPL